MFHDLAYVAKDFLLADTLPAVAIGLSGGALASGFGPSWSKRSLIAARRGSRR